MSYIPSKILIISSGRISQGPNIMVKQFYNAFNQQGYEVDLLLKYPEPNHPEYMYVVKDDYEKTIFARLRNKFCRFLSRKWTIADNQHFFFYSKEKYPPIPSRFVVKKIKKEYDLVLIVFWQGLLSFETIKKIYNKLECQIHFIGVDFSQMSGGCHFPCSCDNFRTGCGQCPALLSHDENDFTAWNVKYRKKVYEKVKPIIYGNIYMQQFYSNSYLLKDANCEILPSAIIDTELFKPLDQDVLKEKYNIPTNKKYTLLFGSQYLHDYRKGVSYLLESLTLLSQKMKDEKANVLVLVVGRGYEELKDKIPFDSIGIGYVAMEKLPETFALATCFICPSIDDAGPMMVNQSLCCGIPVVGFETGSVLQVVKDKGTGVCVPVKDTQKLAEGIYEIIKLPINEYNCMRKRCRDVALQTSSYKAQTDIIVSTYSKYTKCHY